MPPRKAASFSPALKALCMHHDLPACYLEAGERPVLANGAFEAQAARLIGAPWQAIASQPHDLLAARARPAMAQGRPAFSRGGWVTPAGEHWDLQALPFLDETGRCLGVVLYFQPPAPLGERGRLAEAAIANAAEALLLVEGRQISPQNEAATRLFACPTPGARLDLEAFRRPFSIATPSGEPLTAEQDPFEAAIAGRSLQATTFQLRGPEGERVIQLRVTPLLSLDRAAPSALVTAVDLTAAIGERRLARETLSEKVAELEGAMATMCEIDRLKTDFLNTMSHELRTPLSAIMGYVEFLEEGVAGELTDQQLEFLAHVGASAHELLAMIDNLLDFARLEAGRLHLVPSPIDLCVLIQELLPRFEGRATAKGIRLAIEREPGLAPVMADHTRLIQVLSNLLDNALKFTPEGGTVTLSCAAGAPGRVEVAVADTGIGIPPEAMNRMFSKFFQVESGLRRETGGTGLGLAISKLLVEAQGGQIGLESHLGAGTRVWVSLPVWKEA